MIQSNHNSDSSYQQLQKCMSDKGILCPDEMHLDGRLHRYSYKGTKEKDEWYWGVILSSGHIYCTFGSWRDIEKTTFTSFGSSPLSEEESAYLKQACEEFKNEEEDRAAEAKKHASKIYFSLNPALVSHPYLRKKNVYPHNIRERGEDLVIPLYDAEGNISTLQKISPSGEKRFLAHGKCSFCFYPIGDFSKSSKIFVCEGFATGASIYQESSIPVAVAFSCSNLFKVGHLLRSKYPGKKIMLASDLGNAGDKAVSQWKEHLNDCVYQPDFKGKQRERDSDFNDLANHPDLKGEAARQLVPKWKAISLKDFVQKEIPSPTWLIENLFQEGSFNIVAGEGGIGKSAFCLELAICCALGRTLLGKECKRCKVLIVDGEMPEALLHDRMRKSLLRHAQYENFDDISLDLICMATLREEGEDAIDLYSSSSRDKLKSMYDNYDVVILDNFSCLSEEGEEESRSDNSSAAWYPVKRLFIELRDQGKTTILLHHTSKAGDVRGSSAKRGDTDTILLLKQSTKVYTELPDLAFDLHVSKGRSIAYCDRPPLHVDFQQARVDKEIQWVSGKTMCYGWRWSLLQRK